MVDKVKLPSQFKEMMDELKGTGPFEKLTNIMIFAACLGFKRQNRKVIGKPAQDPIRLDTFNDPYDQAIMNVIAFLENDRDPLMLSETKQDEKIKIFEEYACGGLEIIHREIWESKLNTPPDSLDNELINMILNEYEEDNILTNLADEISSVSNL